MNRIITKLNSSQIKENLESLLNLGADANKLAAKIEPSQLTEKEKAILKRHGASRGSLMAAKLKGAVKKAILAG